jgi:hypothetical protein
VTLAPHLPPGWNSVSVDNVPVGRGTMSLTLRRSSDAITVVARRRGSSRAPVELVFSPALPLGARIAGSAAAARSTPGDLHATIRAALTDSVVLTVRFTGGWGIVPPAMPATIGSRSRAPRVLSERGSGDQYVVSLEGLSGQTYTFDVRTPDEPSARSLDAAAGGGGAVKLLPAAGQARRAVDVTFPPSGANADGYTAATVTFTRSARP